jgi:hypothetical protein
MAWAVKRPCFSADGKRVSSRQHQRGTPSNYMTRQSANIAQKRQRSDAAMQVPLLESQLKQHFCPALHRHFVCLPSIAVAAQAVLVAFFCAWAWYPAGAARIRANAHANPAIHLVITIPFRPAFPLIRRRRRSWCGKLERPMARPRWSLRWRLGPEAPISEWTRRRGVQGPPIQRAS